MSVHIYVYTHMYSMCKDILLTFFSWLNLMTLELLKWNFSNGFQNCIKPTKIDF